MSVWFATVPWQEVVVIIIVGAAIFGLALCFGRRSCGGCGHCTCPEDEKQDPAVIASDAEKQR